MREGYPIGAMSTGAILDTAIRIMVRDRRVLKIAVIVFLPITMVESLAVEVPAEFEYLYWAVTTGAWLLLYPIAYAAVANTVAGQYFGKPLRLKKFFLQIVPFLPTILLVWFFFVLVFVPAVLLLVLPGLLWASRYGLASYLAALEGLTPRESFRRSATLLKGSRKSCILIILVTTTLEAALAFGIEYLPGSLLRHGVASLAYTLLYTLGCVAFVILYFSCRSKVENFDLELLASRAAADAELEGDSSSAEIPGMHVLNRISHA